MAQHFLLSAKARTLSLVKAILGSRRSATVLDDDGMIIGLHDFGHARRLSREQTEQWQALGDVQCREILPTRLNFAEMTDITFMNRLYDCRHGHSIDF